MISGGFGTGGGRWCSDLSRDCFDRGERVGCPFQTIASTTSGNSSETLAALNGSRSRRGGGLCALPTSPALRDRKNKDELALVRWGVDLKKALDMRLRPGNRGGGEK